MPSTLPSARSAKGSMDTRFCDSWEDESLLTLDPRIEPRSQREFPCYRLPRFNPNRGAGGAIVYLTRRPQEISAT
jgi:hypothetical protein